MIGVGEIVDFGCAIRSDPTLLWSTKPCPVWNPFLEGFRDFIEIFCLVFFFADILVCDKRSRHFSDHREYIIRESAGVYLEHIFDMSTREGVSTRESDANIYLLDGSLKGIHIFCSGAID